MEVTEKHRFRPVYLRHLERKENGFPQSLPSDEEKADAIAVMQECYPPVWVIDEILLCEAENIFWEASK